MKTLNEYIKRIENNDPTLYKIEDTGGVIIISDHKERRLFYALTGSQITKKITTLKLSFYNGAGSKISDIVALLPNLTELELFGEGITNINVSLLKSLKILNICATSIAEIYLSAITQLTKLRLDSNKITNIDLTNQGHLTWLSMEFNNLKHINLSSLHEVRRVNLMGNKLEHITGLNELTSLKYLNVGFNNLSSLHIPCSPKLKELWCDARLSNKKVLRLITLPADILNRLKTLVVPLGRLTEATQIALISIKKRRPELSLVGFAAKAPDGFSVPVDSKITPEILQTHFELIISQWFTWQIEMKENTDAVKLLRLLTDVYNEALDSYSMLQAAFACDPEQKQTLEDFYHRLNKIIQAMLDYDSIHMKMLCEYIFSKGAAAVIVIREHLSRAEKISMSIAQELFLHIYFDGFCMEKSYGIHNNLSDKKLVIITEIINWLKSLCEDKSELRSDVLYLLRGHPAFSPERTELMKIVDALEFAVPVNQAPITPAYAIFIEQSDNSLEIKRNPEPKVKTPREACCQMM